jgi:hypothetical protein
MSTIYLELPVDTDEVLDNVCRADEEDFLLDALENFESDNVTAALREFFRSQRERGAALPDFVDAEKL